MPAVRGTTPCQQDTSGACNAGVPPAQNEASDADGNEYMPARCRRYEGRSRAGKMPAVLVMPASRGCLEELRHGFGELRMAVVSEVNAVVGGAGGEEHAS